MNRNSELQAAGDRALRLVKNHTAIGSRWTRSHVVRIDTNAGSYEELNAPSHRLSDDALGLQTALLTPAPIKGNGKIRSVLLASAIGIVIAAVLFFGLSQ